MTLMIVEDNTDFREMLKKIFNPYFSVILETDNGEEAVEKYNKNTPDWVFMDIKINGMDGISAAKIIKDKHPEAMIVMVSNYNNQRIINAAMKAGALGFVPKDDISKLFKLIK